MPVNIPNLLETWYPFHLKLRAPYCPCLLSLQLNFVVLEEVVLFKNQINYPSVNNVGIHNQRAKMFKSLQGKS